MRKVKVTEMFVNEQIVEIKWTRGPIVGSAIFNRKRSSEKMFFILEGQELAEPFRDRLEFLVTLAAIRTYKQYTKGESIWRTGKKSVKM